MSVYRDSPPFLSAHAGLTSADLPLGWFSQNNHWTSHLVLVIFHPLVHPATWLQIAIVSILFRVKPSSSPICFLLQLSWIKFAFTTLMSIWLWFTLTTFTKGEEEHKSKLHFIFSSDFAYNSNAEFSGELAGGNA